MRELLVCLWCEMRRGSDCSSWRATTTGPAKLCAPSPSSSARSWSAGSRGTSCRSSSASHASTARCRARSRRRSTTSRTGSATSTVPSTRSATRSPTSSSRRRLFASCVSTGDGRSCVVVVVTVASCSAAEYSGYSFQQTRWSCFCENERQVLRPGTTVAGCLVLEQLYSCSSQWWLWQKQFLYASNLLLRRKCNV